MQDHKIAIQCSISQENEEYI